MNVALMYMYVEAKCREPFNLRYCTFLAALRLFHYIRCRMTNLEFRIFCLEKINQPVGRQTNLSDDRFKLLQLARWHFPRAYLFRELLMPSGWDSQLTFSWLALLNLIRTALVEFQKMSRWIWLSVQVGSLPQNFTMVIFCLIRDATTKTFKKGLFWYGTA
jgi:hypothetical protein